MKMQKNYKKDDSSGCKSEFWGICCESGKRYSQVVCKKFHISMAALDPTDTLTSPCVSLMVERDGCQYLLCSLKPDSILQVILNLYFDKGEDITFFLKGHGTVHLSGYYICDKNEVGFNENSRKDQMSTLAKKGGRKPQTSFTVSADVETLDDEKTPEIEEVKKDVIKGKNVSSAKKPFASPSILQSLKKGKSPKITSNKDSSEGDSSEDVDSEDEPDKTVSPAKKLFASPATLPSLKKGKSPKKDSSEEESSEDDDSEDEPDKIPPIKKLSTSPAKLISPKKVQSPKITSKNDSSEEDFLEDDDSEDERDKTGYCQKLITSSAKRFYSTLESDDESSDDDDSSSDSSALKAGLANLNKQLQNKKFKADASTPAQNSKVGKKTPSKPAVIDLEDDTKTEKPDINSSIGRTPMPKKPASSLFKQSAENDSFLSKMNTPSKLPKKDTSVSEKMDVSATVTPDKSTNQLDTSVQSESAKKKKKKKAKAAASENLVVDATNKLSPKVQYSHKLPSGVEYEDVIVGNGLVAKKGKLIHVYYIGRLDHTKNNKIFDSCRQGSKPFSFKLGSGQVIKGWDVGIEGMKVGGKRKLKIPPNMGYSNQRMGDIAPNSTLFFVVELKAVS